MLAVLEAFAVIAIIIVVGMIVGRGNVLGDNARMVLNRVAFHIGVPALLLLSLADSTPSQVFSLPLLVSSLTTMVMFGVYFVIAVTLRRRDRADATIGAWAASWVNSGNLGIPLSAYVLGSTTEVSALIVFQTVVLVPLGVGIINSAGRDGGAIGAQVRSLVTNPIIVASAIGTLLAFTGVTLPRAVHQPLELLADLAIPTVLIAFGIALVSQTGRDDRENRVDLWLAIVFKVLVMPALAYVLARWAFGLSAEQTAIATVLAALPAAQNLNTYASVFERGESLARNATLITTLASVPSIAVIAYLLGL
ncbi:AEC family transporter [Mycobacterium sp. NPDC003323]